MSYDVPTAEIRARVESGELHRWLVELTEAGPEAASDQAYAAVLELHAKSELDLLAILLDSNLSWELGPDYQARARLYGQLLPRLETSAARLVIAIRAIKKAVWQHSLDEPFKLWCEAQPGRPDEVVALVRTGTALENRFLVPALVAGYRVQPARFLALAADLARSPLGDPTGGLYALGAMRFVNEVDRNVALDALAAVGCDKDVAGETKAAALFAAMNVVARTPDLDLTVAEALLAGATAEAHPDVIRECAMALARHGKVLPPGFRVKLAKALRNVDMGSPMALNSVDIGLNQLLCLGPEEEAFDCVEHLATASGERDLLGHLGSVTHELLHGDRSRLGRLLARWLGSGRPALCAAARDLVRQSGNQRLTCDGNLGNASWPNALTVYVARQAIGWLMPHPTAPASIIVGLLKEADHETAQHLVELLLDPLLVNYPLAVKEYLGAVSPQLPDHAGRWVAAALSRHAAYIEALRRVGFVPELQPSRRHRQLEHRHRSATMNAAMREARAQSPLLSMMGQSLLLYGKRAVCRVTDFDGTERRLENKLGLVGAEIDHTMGWTYDPNGLEFMLFHFRTERRPG